MLKFLKFYILCRNTQDVSPESIDIWYMFIPTFITCNKTRKNYFLYQNIFHSTSPCKGEFIQPECTRTYTRIYIYIYIYITKSNLVISIYLSGFLKSFAVFRKPNAIPLCFSIDLVLNFLLSWLLALLPSTFFLDVLFSITPVVSNP